MVNHDSSFSGDSHVIQNSTFADLADVRLSNGEPAPTLEACFDQAWKLVRERKMEDQVVWIAFSWELSNYIHTRLLQLMWRATWSSTSTMAQTTSQQISLQNCRL